MGRVVMTAQWGANKPQQTLPGFCACGRDMWQRARQTQLHQGPDFVFSDHAVLLVCPQLKWRRRRRSCHGCRRPSQLTNAQTSVNDRLSRPPNWDQSDQKRIKIGSTSWCSPRPAVRMGRERRGTFSSAVKADCCPSYKVTRQKAMWCGRWTMQRADCDG